jgi:hypothetical protein
VPSARRIPLFVPKKRGQTEIVTDRNTDRVKYTVQVVPKLERSQAFFSNIAPNGRITCTLIHKTSGYMARFMQQPLALDTC